MDIITFKNEIMMPIINQITANKSHIWDNITKKWNEIPKLANIHGKTDLAYTLKEGIKEYLTISNSIFLRELHAFYFHPKEIKDKLFKVYINELKQNNKKIKHYKKEIIPINDEIEIKKVLANIWLYFSKKNINALRVSERVKRNISDGIKNSYLEFLDKITTITQNLMVYTTELDTKKLFLVLCDILVI